MSCCVGWAVLGGAWGGAVITGISFDDEKGSEVVCASEFRYS